MYNIYICEPITRLKKCVPEIPQSLHGVRAWLGDGGAGRRGELAAVRAGSAARGGGVSVSIGRVQSEERAGGAGWSWRGEIPNRALVGCYRALSARIWSCCAVWHVFGYTRVLLFSELRRRDKQLLVGDC